MLAVDDVIGKHRSEYIKDGPGKVTGMLNKLLSGIGMLKSLAEVLENQNHQDIMQLSGNWMGERRYSILKTKLVLESFTLDPSHSVQWCNWTDTRLWLTSST